MKKILLTGAHGFIGKNILETFIGRYQLVEVSRKSQYDILSLDSLMQIDDVDVVIHAAAKTFVPDSFNNPYTFYEFNLKSTLNIAEFCRIKKVQKIIYLNSYTYGTPNYLPINELHPISFHSPYNKSKYLAEQLLFTYLENICSITSLRLFNLYGKYQNDNFLIPEILKNIRQKKSIKVKDLTPKRDYLYIKDLLLLIEQIIKLDSVGGIYNIGSGKSYSVQEIIDELQSILKIDLPILSDNVRRENEILNCIADIKKIQNETQWSPQYSLKSGLLDYLKEGEL